MIKHEVSIESATEAIIEAIFENLINSWNETNAQAFSDLFSETGSMVGFDGTTASGKQDIYNHLSSVFADHTPAKFVSIVKRYQGSLSQRWVIESRGRHGIYGTEKNKSKDKCNSIVGCSE